MELDVKAPSSVHANSEATLAHPVGAITARPDGLQTCGPWAPNAIAFPYQSPCDSVYDEAPWETVAERDADEPCGDAAGSDDAHAWDDEVGGGTPALCDDDVSCDEEGLDDELCDVADPEARSGWDWALNVLSTLVFAAQINPLSRSSAGPTGIVAKGIGAGARSATDRSALIATRNPDQQPQRRKPTGAAVSRFDAATQLKAVRKSQGRKVTVVEVAKEFGISLSTLDKWRARWLPWLAKREPGSWQAKPGRRRSHLSNEEWEQLFELWPHTPRRQRKAVARQFGVSPANARARYRRWKAGRRRTAIPAWNLSWEEVVSRQPNGVSTTPTSR